MTTIYILRVGGQHDGRGNSCINNIIIEIAATAFIQQCIWSSASCKSHCPSCLCKMSAFLRLRLLEAQLEKRTPQQFCAVNIKETVHSPGEGLKLIQHKSTFYPDWNKCFDSHLVQGRRMQVRHNSQLFVTVQELLWLYTLSFFQ